MLWRYDCLDSNKKIEKILKKKDINDFVSAAYALAHNDLFGNKCYISPIRGFLRRNRNVSLAETTRILKEEYPDEFQKEIASKETCKNEIARQYRILYGIAKRNHVAVKRCNYEPDCFIFYQKGVRLGELYVMA